MRHTPFLSLFPSFLERHFFAAAQRHPRKIPARLRAAPAGVCLLLPCLAVAAPFAYIANHGSNNVSVIDTAINSVVATIAVGTSPKGVAVNPAGTRVYVTNADFGGPGTVSVIDTASNNVTATVAVGDAPAGVAVNPAGTRVYVTNQSSNTVSVIDTATNNVTATVPVGSAPIGVAVNPAGTRVYVANMVGTVSVIDTASNNVTATVAVGSYPIGVAVSPDGTRVYVANESSHSVSVIDAASNSVTATVAVGSNPNGVAVNPAGTRVYVTNAVSDSVSVIDTASDTVTTTVTAGDYPFGVAVNPAGTRVYVVNTGSNNVMVIDTASNNVIATVPVGSIPYSLGQFIGEPPSVPDTTPDPFGFTAQTGAALSSFVTSNAITVSGINAPSAIGIVGGSYSINGGAYVTTAGTVSNGNTVSVRQTSSAAYNTLTTATLTIGGVSGTFNVTTLADPSVATGYTAASATGTGNITASFSGGGAGCGYTVSQFIPLTGNLASPPSAPAGVSFPHGLFDFTTGGCTPGSTLNFTITYPQPLPAGTMYWKYGPSPDGYNCSGVACAAAHWYQMPPAQAVFAGNTVTLTITDGGVGDDDLAANGVIVDQGGPGVPGAAGIPTLSEWALLLLAGLMGLLGMAQVRRRALL